MSAVLLPRRRWCGSLPMWITVGYQGVVLSCCDFNSPGLCQNVITNYHGAVLLTALQSYYIAMRIINKEIWAEWTHSFRRVCLTSNRFTSKIDRVLQLWASYLHHPGSEPYYSRLRVDTELYYSRLRVDIELYYSRLRVDTELYYSGLRVDTELYYSRLRVDTELYYSGLRVDTELYYSRLRVDTEPYYSRLRVDTELYYSRLQVDTELYYTVFSHWASLSHTGVEYSPTELACHCNLQTTHRL